MGLGFAWLTDDGADGLEVGLGSLLEVDCYRLCVGKTSADFRSGWGVGACGWGSWRLTEPSPANVMSKGSPAVMSSKSELVN